MTIHAYTESGRSFPAYVNLAEVDAGAFALSVRSSGNDGRDLGVIQLSREQLMNLVSDASGHLDLDVANVTASACFGITGTEEQQLRIRSFEMALHTPGVRTHRDVIGVAGAYHKRIVGDEPMGASEKTPAPGAAHPGYSTMQPHQQRVADEQAELDGRRIKLQAFFDTTTFASLDEAEQQRMRTQYVAMKALSDILGERIAAFAPA
ncbi:hypothetical protein HH212_00135 [Massilia forsythiae]|uniref:Uncharacterized protein n=1 Tax=Massilia forsythiae TaxID=2728020 RepID=A0A7Z2ZQN9_9BURK|nr:hypothetical protein [Massilia forsythiae]QJD98645.1 hypothetical protein HH212_00135 [Massilia forsythiae]